MRRRGLLVTTWAGATAVATFVAWAAVDQVTDEVAPSAAVPLPAAVAAAQPAQAPVTPGPGDRGTEQPKPQPDPTADPQPQAAGTVGYDLVGGAVTVRYRGATTELVQATPRSGFVVDVREGGPDKVEVRFSSDRHESRLLARVSDGRPDADRDERPR